MVRRITALLPIQRPLFSTREVTVCREVRLYFCAEQTDILVGVVIS